MSKSHWKAISDELKQKDTQQNNPGLGRKDRRGHGPKEGKPIGRVVTARTAESKAFKVYRDDETDEFKQTSIAAVDLLATVPPDKKLTRDERDLVDSVASNLERSLSKEQVIPETQRTKISEEAQLEIEKMPTWLGAMVALRYDKIKDHFKDETLKFLKGVNTKIDKEYRPEFAYFAGMMTSDEVINYEDAEINSAISEMTLHVPEDEGGTSQDKLFKNDGNVVFLVTEAIGRWKRSKENSKMWHPRLVHAVAKKLRHDLTLKPSTADIALTKQDVVHHHHSDSEDSDFDEFGKLRWEVIRRREAAQRDAEFELELDLTKVPKGRRAPSYIDDVSIKKNQAQLEAKMKALKRKRNEKGLGRVAVRRQLYRRGHFRRHSRLLVNSCGEKNVRPKRLEYHVRTDDTFHHYIVTLVGSVAFRAFIMLMIFLNAVALTIEPLESLRDYALTWRVIDEFFLAMYLLEAILKIYAHPIGYWKSGFNVFDFCILVVSLVKMINDWLDVADIRFLRVLLIVRALRILRGISLSVQLQVLVAALAQTVRTHVLSVVVLLVLLLYIASIGAFYLFADQSAALQRSWGYIPAGMLRMIVFVTMDGWTDILEEFVQADQLLLGRIFNLICIVLGNFMFSNIFIAIIIMNITEATELYRERMRRDKQEIVRRKKENVFRRQKLDMRQLLARQKKSSSTDFYHLAEQFQKLLRHDDLVKMTDICSSPLWIDALYKTLLRTHHTSVLLMNLHRLMAENLVDLNRYYTRGKMEIKTIRRGRYNRYMRIKAKLTLLKKEIIKLRNDPPKSKLRVRLPPDDLKPQPQEPRQSNAPSEPLTSEEK